MIPSKALNIFLFQDAPALSPGWKYNFNDVKDIIATESFLSLDNKGCSGVAGPQIVRGRFLSKLIWVHCGFKNIFEAYLNIVRHE